MPIERYELDTVVIGAGVVGLAVARSLAIAGRSVWIVDKEDNFGRHTSSRNSEVIHAGIYYPEDSLKARLCVRGKELLYGYLAEKSLPYARCGKLIVACNAKQSTRLDSIAERAAINGVADLQRLTASELEAIVPELSASTALHSPSTGIVDSHAYMQSLLNDAEMHGATFLPGTEVRLLAASSECFELELVGQNAIVRCSSLVNAAGLFATALLEEVESFPKVCLPEPVFAKGSYFSYSGKVPFKQLIYPVPEDGGLGVHLTLDLGGAARFGPDVEWCSLGDSRSLDSFDYAVDPSKRDAFASRIREYWPGLDPEKLHPDYSGLRPKIRFGEEVYLDFCVQGEQEHGLKGLINLFGIESPGLTASLALAEHVCTQLN